MRARILLPMTALVAACGTLPDVPLPRGGLDRDAAYPSFVPLENVAFERIEAQERNAETEELLEARVAGLRARADRLRTAEVE